MLKIADLAGREAIAFDYTVPVTAGNIDRHGVRTYDRLMRRHHANEQLLFSIADEELEWFLSQRKLKLVERLDNTRIENTLLADGGGAPIGRIIAHFRFAQAQSR